MANQRPKSHKALFVAAIAALLSLACGTQSDSSNKRSEDDHVAVVTTNSSNSSNTGATPNRTTPTPATPTVAPASTTAQGNGQTTAPAAGSAQAGAIDPIALMIQLTQFSQQAAATHQQEVDAQLAAIKAKHDAEHPSPTP